MSFLTGKKLKELLSENEDLRKRMLGLTEKENHLKRYDDLVKKARIEYAEIATKKDQTAQKLEVLDKEKAKLIGELNKLSLEIKQLREIKLTEHNQVRTLNNLIGNSIKTTEDKNDTLLRSSLLISNEIEAAEKRKNDIALETFKIRKQFEVINNKISDGKKVLDTLYNEIEKKKEEISSSIQKQKSVSSVKNKNSNFTFEERDAGNIHSVISELEFQENELTEKINNRIKQLDELDREIKQKQISFGSEIKLDRQSENESIKKQRLIELEIKIEANETQLANLNEELKAKTELYYELLSDNERILRELKSGKEKLAELNETIEVETIKLTDLDYSLNILEDEFDKLSDDISEKMTIREEIELQLHEKKNQKVELEDLLKDLRETTTILAQLKNDIEKGSGQSARRFTGVLQYYSSMINDISKKKTNLEKVLTQKKKELKEKQNLIYEKQSTLEQMENIIITSHQRFKLIDELTSDLNYQRTMLEETGSVPEHRIQEGQQVVNIKNSQVKLLEYENALRELLSDSDKYSGNLLSSKSLLENEIENNKNSLNKLSQNIRSSTNELTELHNSISKIKIEHEEHRISINKLASIRTRLDEEIRKNKFIVEKYSSIKEKIRQEQEIIKKKREISSKLQSSANPGVGEKTFDTHSPKWIKL